MHFLICNNMDHKHSAPHEPLRGSSVPSLASFHSSFSTGYGQKMREDGDGVFWDFFGFNVNKSAYLRKRFCGVTFQPSHERRAEICAEQIEGISLRDWIFIRVSTVYEQLVVRDVEDSPRQVAKMHFSGRVFQS